MLNKGLTKIRIYLKKINLFDDFKTKFSSLLTMNLANTPLRKRKNVKIIKAIIISEIFIPETPLFQTSKNRFLKFSKTFI